MTLWPYQWKQCMRIFAKRKTLYLIGLVIFLSCTFAVSELINEGPIREKGKERTIPIIIDLASQDSFAKIIRFNVDERKIYAFNVGFFYKKNDQYERARVRSLIGDETGKTEDQSARSIFIRASLYRVNEGRLSILEKVDFDSRRVKIKSWGDDAFRKEMTSLQLEEGVYELHIEEVLIERDLRISKIRLEIVEAYRGK